MKKILYLLMALTLSMGMMTSCKTAKFGVSYAATVVGDADGKVDVTFPQGRFAMDGDAAVDFRVSNDTTVLAGKVYTKEEALNSGDKKVIDALYRCAAFANENFQTTDADGTYDLTINAFVRETLTGIGFEWEKHLTNREPANAPSRAAAQADTITVEQDPLLYIK